MPSLAMFWNAGRCAQLGGRLGIRLLAITVRIRISPSRYKSSWACSRDANNTALDRPDRDPTMWCLQSCLRTHPKCAWAHAKAHSEHYGMRNTCGSRASSPEFAAVQGQIKSSNRTYLGLNTNSKASHQNTCRNDYPNMASNS